MVLRYLFGPVVGRFAEENLHPQRRAGTCLTFGPDGSADLTLNAGGSWDDLRREFPDGWEPDFLVVTPAYGTVPPCLWHVPLPKVGLAADWNLLWHGYRGELSRFDLVLADSLGAEVMACEGIAARQAVWAGCERMFVEDVGEGEVEQQRDIDVLFVGNLNPAVQRERAPWRTRLARLGKRWRVQIRAGIFGEEYRRLLKRSKIVFQFSARGKAGRRSFEAANCGALVFQELGNRELPAFFRDGLECVYYGADNLEELVAYYLEHEEERSRLAEAARRRARSCRYDELWQEQVDAIEREWPALREQVGHVDVGEGWQELTTRAWQALTSTRFDDAALIRDLQRALTETPESALLANLIGCMLWRQGRGRNPPAVVASVANDFFRRAIDAQPEFVLAGMNLAESLEAAGRRSEAIETARSTLDRLHGMPALEATGADGMPLCQPFESFHIEWERAGWRNAGAPMAEASAKRDLILCKLHGMVGAWTGELFHYYEAALTRPDLSFNRTALGEALVRAERLPEANEHFRRAVADNPLDREAARTAWQILGSLKDAPGRRRLSEDRRLLAQAAPLVMPVENWFAEPRPKANELVSILIMCHERLERVRQCLDSVVRHTRGPYELVLVDNASSDGTRELLQEIARRRASASNGAAAPVRVELVRSESQLGYARGYNQALRKARGRFVAFLGSDTVVAPGWLPALIAPLLREWPAVGLVGPVSNAAAPPQAIRVNEGGTRAGAACSDDINRFAAERRRTWAGRSMGVTRLAGFCLLAPRDMLERLGGLDESFALSFFAAGDLGLRVREAGSRLMVAQDVFVHRFDAPLDIPETDATRGKDYERLLAKWGSSLTQGYQPVEEKKTVTAPATDSAMIVDIEEIRNTRRHGISLCMIVRNEENNLPECLRTVQGLFDETIVVDTGSTDGTVEQAQRFGARVFAFPWIDSFGAARNESLRHATGKWIMWLDADDRLDAENRDRLRKLIAELGDDCDAYAIQVRSVLDHKRTTFRLLDQVRLFRNLPSIRWDYRIHEQILPAVNRAGGTVRWTDVIVDHVGYQDVSVRRGKLERNLRLLELDHAERPDDSFSLFNLGWTLLDLGRVSEALPHLRHSLETAKSDSSILRKLYHLLAVARRQLGAPEEALKSCQEGLTRFPDDGELLLELGLMQRDRGDLAGAEVSWLRLLEPRQGKYFSSEDVGLRGFQTRQLLAEIYARQDRWAEAEIQWRAALDERVDFEPAWGGLADLYVRCARWHDLEELVRRLEGEGIAPPKVGWLRARGQVQRKEYAAARKVLAEVIAQDAAAIGPRVLLSQALLQEGRDLPAAEQALLQVLEIDPENKDARHNLDLLRRQSTRPRHALVPR